MDKPFRPVFCVMTQSRRLQLAVEQCRVPCFLHRYQPRSRSAIASVCRWEIKPVASIAEGDLPGVGFPAWAVALEKVRNGQPGNWQVQWVEDRFKIIEESWHALHKNEDASIVRTG